MLSLPFGFTIYQYVGLWQPSGWYSNWKSKLYAIYIFILMVLLNSGILSQLIVIFQPVKNIEELIDKTVFFLSTFQSSVKAANFLNRRQDINNLIMTLKNHQCHPRDAKEKSIQNKFDKIVKTMHFMSMSGIGVLITTSVSFYANIPTRSLPFESWFPFDTSTSLNYWIAYFHQIFGLALGAAINVGYDTIVPGLMLEICVQFEILTHRLSLFTSQEQSENLNIDGMIQKTKRITDYVDHHYTIIQCADNLTEIFNFVCFIQFLISTAVICVTAYCMSQLSLNDPAFVSRFVYLVCMLYQLFLYCYAGSEVIAKSTELSTGIQTEAETGWYSLCNKNRKSLLLMMTRSQRPVTITTGYIIELSMVSYTQVLRLSYSIYNVLKPS